MNRKIFLETKDIDLDGCLIDNLIFACECNVIASQIKNKLFSQSFVVCTEQR